MTNKSNKATILVVDDDQSIIDAVKTALETREYRVISASSGEEALERFEDGDIDIAFCDIKMPGMDGIELLKRIQEISPQTHCIMMTAYASVDSAVEAMREGAADYLRKPFEVEDIKSTVLGALEDLEFEEKHKDFVSPPELEWETPIEAFKSWVERGREGLIVIAEKSGSVQEQYGLDEDDVEQIVLSKDDSGKNRIHPNELEELRDSVLGFSSNRENGSVVLLDDLDYLLEQNTLDSLKEFISNLEDELSTYNSILIFSGRPQNMEDMVMGELEYLISDMPASTISNSLSNQLRRRIISQLSEEDGISFTTLARKTNINDSPKMSFHLRKLESWGVIEKDEEKKYYLTEMGRNAAEILEEIKTRQKGEPGGAVWVPKS